MSQGPQGGHAAARAADPRTSQAELYELARSQPELRPLIAQNPNTYPELLDWLSGLGDSAIDAAIARRNKQTQDFTQVLPPLAGGENPTQALPPQRHVQPERTEEFEAQRQPQYYPEDDHYQQRGYSGSHTEEHAAYSGYSPAQSYPQYDQGRYSGAGYHSAGQYSPYPSDAPHYDEDPRRRRGGLGVMVFLLLLLIGGGIAAILAVFTVFSDEEDTEEPHTVTEDQPEPAEDPTPEPEGTTEEDVESPSPSPTEESPSPEDQAARPAPEGALAIEGFSAPSGNIHCAVQGDALSCTIVQYEFDTPGNCADAVTFTVDGEGAVQAQCASGVGPQPVSLNYGQSAASGDFACTAEATHFECWSTSTGNGFEVAREYYTLTEQ